MGQKTHPKAFRLVTTQNHLGRWFAKNSDYATFSQEDFQIREKIEKSFLEILEISSIEIQRAGDIATIKINAFYPRELILSSTIKENFREHLLNPLYKNYKTKEWASIFLKQKIREILHRFQKTYGKTYLVLLKLQKNRYHHSSLIANSIATQLNQRIPFRRITKTIIKKVLRNDIKGIKIELSGRLNGVDIARSEWKREGKIPLHTLRANIDYCQKKVKGPQGITGIKIWLFKENQKFSS